MAASQHPRYVGPPVPPLLPVVGRGVGNLPPIPPALSSTLFAQQQAEAAAALEQQQTFMIGYQLCTSLVKDNIAQVAPDLLELTSSADCWVVEAGTGDLKLHSLLEAMQIPHKTITSEQLPLAKLYPNQTVFVNCADEMFMDAIDGETLGKVIAFVNEGGLLVTFGAAVKLLERAFPGKIARAQRRTPDYANAMIKVVSNADPCARAYDQISLECVLDPGTSSVKVLDKANVTVLAHLPPALLGDRVALVKFKAGAGLIYHFVCELCERERVSSEPKKVLTPYLTRHGATKATQLAWECAAKCRYPGSYPIAQSAYPLMYFISYVALLHKKELKDYRIPMDPEQVAQAQMMGQLHVVAPPVAPPPAQTPAPTDNGVTAAAPVTATAPAPGPAEMQDGDPMRQ